MKRIFDIIVSGCGLLLLSPLLVVIAIWVKLDSEGPVFYRQVRVGRYNKDFRIFKFRSMCIGSDKGSLVTIGGKDPRVTNSGYYIRKYKLDELPQLINVFMGDMSLVGPRPEVRHYVNYWTAEQMYVLDVRPGITDPASIKFRNENELMEKASDPENYYINVIMQEKIKLYLDYVQNASFGYDIMRIYFGVYILPFVVFPPLWWVLFNVDHVIAENDQYIIRFYKGGFRDYYEKKTENNCSY